MEETESDIQAHLAMDPTNAGLHVKYGYLLMRLGRPEEAEAAFRQAIKLEVFEVEPLVGLSRMLAHIGRHYEAIDAIEAAIALKPNVVAFRVHLGDQLSLTDQFDEAVHAYGAALSIDPSHEYAKQRLEAVQNEM